MSVNRTTYFTPDESFVLFTLLSFIQLGLVLFISPGLTAGVISTEREKQTLPILLTTSQSSFQIISGKLLSSIAFLLLLIFAGLPIYSLVFLFGGISPMDFGLVFLFLFVTLFAIGSLGVMFSTIIRRTIVSMIATYGTMLFLTTVTGFLSDNVCTVDVVKYKCSPDVISRLFFSIDKSWSSDGVFIISGYRVKEFLRLRSLTFRYGELI